MGVKTMKGTRLKELRERKRLTQSQLAEVLDVSQQAVGKWELDKASPDDNTLIRIANYFGVTTDYLLGYDDKPTYYTDPETALLAQELKDNPEYRALLDATKGLKPESVKEIMAFIKFQKAKEEGL
jgi:transcriptional regulator with XRE-family HTH domain